jgi:hypothetical protein
MVAARICWGGDVLGEAKREAPVRTEPHPTRSFALPALEASRVGLPFGTYTEHRLEAYATLGRCLAAFETSFPLSGKQCSIGFQPVSEPEPGRRRQ